MLDYLGELRTDAAGRLLVLGGTGRAYQAPSAGALSDTFNNDGWFNDVSDGPVTAELYLKVNGKRTRVDVQPAWVLVGPPDFGPDLKPMVTLYDLLFDVCARRVPVPKDEAAYRSGELRRFAAIAADLAGGKNTSFSSYKVSFDDDVLPILRQIIHVSYVFKPAADHHFAAGAADPAGMWPYLSDPAQGEGVRRSLVARLRLTATAGPDVGGRNMPKMLGDDPYNDLGTSRWGLILTSPQLAVLDAWQNGKFIGTSLSPPSLMNPPTAAAITPHGLDRAALEGCSGGAFYPGIEVGWQIRDAAFSEPFRLAHGASSTHRFDPKGTRVTAGYFSRQMALPWLTDFLQCRTEEQTLTSEPWAWWPTQRPERGLHQPGRGGPAPPGQHSAGVDQGHDRLAVRQQRALVHGNGGQLVEVRLRRPGQRQPGVLRGRAQREDPVSGYHAVVAGAGPAGCAHALALAARGARVLLAGPEPRHPPGTLELIDGRAAADLAALGLLDRVRAARPAQRRDRIPLGNSRFRHPEQPAQPRGPGMDCGPQYI